MMQGVQSEARNAQIGAAMVLGGVGGFAVGVWRVMHTMRNEGDMAMMYAMAPVIPLYRIAQWTTFGAVSGAILADQVAKRTWP